MLPGCVGKAWATTQQVGLSKQSSLNNPTAEIRTFGPKNNEVPENPRPDPPSPTATGPSEAAILRESPAQPSPFVRLTQSRVEKARNARSALDSDSPKQREREGERDVKLTWNSGNFCQSINRFFEPPNAESCFLSFLGFVSGMLLQCLFIRYILGSLTLFPVFNLFFVLLIMWVCRFAGERERERGLFVCGTSVMFWCLKSAECNWSLIR